MSDKYFAHSENDVNKKHCLSVHLSETARIAGSFANNNEYRKTFQFAGLLHDLGKYQPDFQQYLLEGGKRGSVPHAAWGAGYARLLRQLEISLAVDGHHKGLPDRSKWKNDTEEYFSNQNTLFQSVKESFLKDTGLDVKDFGIQMEFSPLERELFIRYLFSALTDADWLDTEAHFKPEHAAARSPKYLQIDTMIEKLDSAIAQKAKDGEINTLRNKVRMEVLSKSEGSPGFYSLSLPTGMGKTLVSVAWALRHAKANSQKRVIIVLPYINIIDQTAKILKELFGEELILEHHSGFNEESLNDEMTIDSAEKKKRLACENWDYPVIVTTTVQFFESLFSNKPSKCRKIHNIADSVVIFDEVQSLPKEIILPTLTMLKNIQQLMKSSFLFCTATMPAFEKRERFDGIEKIEPLIENPESIYNKTRRVDYRLLKDLQPVNLDDLTEEMRNKNCSVLCIFNTKKAARDAYDKIAVNNSTWEQTYHLSTGMCPVHRKSVIKKIIRDLENGRKILVVSTQLIEAGVDFDFPCVFREIAPLESIIQSAGRCNREGKMPENGKVLLFKLLDGGMPDQAYRTYAEFAFDLISEDLNQLYRYDFFKGYYQKIINLFANPDKFNINELRKNLEFETVNECYHLIAKPTESLFVYRYNDESNKLFNDIKGKPFLSREDYRKIQVYSVQVYKNFLIKNAHFCSATPLGLLIWNGSYAKNTGISTQLMSPDECIV